MLSKSFGPGMLFYQHDQCDTADLVFTACKKSVGVIQQLWGLPAPSDLRVYIMTSWLQFFFHAPPLPYKILMAVTFPLWAFKTNRLWKIAGGWAQNFGSRSTIGIKPPELLEQSDLRIGKRIFIPQETTTKIENNACHELTHAFSLHLPLAGWLREGLTTYTVDRFFGRPTIKPETLDLVLNLATGEDLLNVKPFDVSNPDRTIARFLQGYWLTRYLEETHPGVIRSFLQTSISSSEMHRSIVNGCGKDGDAGAQEFWETIRPELAAHFSVATHS